MSTILDEKRVSFVESNGSLAENELTLTNETDFNDQNEKRLRQSSSDESENSERSKKRKRRIFFWTHESRTWTIRSRLTESTFPARSAAAWTISSYESRQFYGPYNSSRLNAKLCRSVSISAFTDCATPKTALIHRRVSDTATELLLSDVKSFLRIKSIRNFEQRKFRQVLRYFHANFLLTEKRKTSLIRFDTNRLFCSGK